MNGIRMTAEEVATKFCKEKGSDVWWELAMWLAEGDRLSLTAHSQCAAMGRILGKKRDPSAKLSIPCMQVWEKAEELGWEIVKKE